MFGWFSLAALLASRRKFLSACGLSRSALRQDLEGDRAVEDGVLGLVDDAHAAAAELVEHAVAPGPRGLGELRGAGRVGRLSRGLRAGRDACGLEALLDVAVVVVGGEDLLVEVDRLARLPGRVVNPRELVEQVDVACASSSALPIAWRSFFIASVCLPLRLKIWPSRAEACGEVARLGRHLLEQLDRLVVLAGAHVRLGGREGLARAREQLAPPGPDPRAARCTRRPRRTAGRARSSRPRAAQSVAPRNISAAWA